MPLMGAWRVEAKPAVIPPPPQLLKPHSWRFYTNLQESALGIWNYIQEIWEVSLLGLLQNLRLLSTTLPPPLWLVGLLSLQINKEAETEVTGVIQSDTDHYSTARTGTSVSCPLDPGASLSPLVLPHLFPFPPLLLRTAKQAHGPPHALKSWLPAPVPQPTGSKCP